MNISQFSMDKAREEFLTKYHKEILDRAHAMEVESAMASVVYELIRLAPEKKIQHIKIIRRAFGLDLVTAKNAYDRYRYEVLSKDDLPF